MTDLKIAALRYYNDKNRRNNYSSITGLLQQVLSADIVLLHEDSVDPDGQEGETVPGSFTDWLAGQAHLQNITLIGNLLETTRSKRFSSHVIINRQGHLTWVHRKLQPFETRFRIVSYPPGNIRADSPKLTRRASCAE